MKFVEWISIIAGAALGCAVVSIILLVIGFERAWLLFIGAILGGVAGAMYGRRMWRVIRRSNTS